MKPASLTAIAFLCMLKMHDSANLTTKAPRCPICNGKSECQEMVGTAKLTIVCKKPFKCYQTIATSMDGTRKLLGQGCYETENQCTESTIAATYKCQSAKSAFEKCPICYDANECKTKNVAKIECPGVSKCYRIVKIVRQEREKSEEMVYVNCHVNHHDCKEILGQKYRCYRSRNRTCVRCMGERNCTIRSNVIRNLNASCLYGEKCYRIVDAVHPKTVTHRVGCYESLEKCISNNTRRQGNETGNLQVRTEPSTNNPFENALFCVNYTHVFKTDVDIVKSLARAIKTTVFDHVKTPTFFAKVSPNMIGSIFADLKTKQRPVTYKYYYDIEEQTKPEAESFTDEIRALTEHSETETETLETIRTTTVKTKTKKTTRRTTKVAPKNATAAALSVTTKRYGNESEVLKPFEAKAKIKGDNMTGANIKKMKTGEKNAAEVTYAENVPIGLSLFAIYYRII